MLSRKAQYSLVNAKAYFEEHLSTGDYYSEGETVGGHWFGEGAESLRLLGTVKRDEFLRLCDNLDPRTGELLTLRLKTTRNEIGDDGDPHNNVLMKVTFPPLQETAFVFTFHEEGLFPFICPMHRPEMNGQILVLPPTSGEPAREPDR